jgi:hypothetical protein
MKFAGAVRCLCFCAVIAALVSSQAYAEKSDEMKKAVQEGYGITTTGLFFLIGGAALQYCAVPVAFGGNGGSAVGLSLAGAGLQIAGPIMISGGATHAERASERFGYKDNPANAWGYYKAGLILQLVGNASNLIPWQIVVYDKTDYSSNGYNHVQVTIAPIPLIVGLISQIMYIVNTANAYSYLATANKLFVEPEGSAPRVVPQFSYSNGKYSAGLVFPF